MPIEVAVPRVRNFIRVYGSIQTNGIRLIYATSKLPNLKTQFVFKSDVPDRSNVIGASFWEVYEVLRR